MKKTVCIGKQKTYRGRIYRVYCSIEFKDGELSISGVEGPLVRGNCLGSCGQIMDGVYWDMISLDKGWSPEILKRFIEIWDKWHLNHLHAECEHQERLGWTRETHSSKVCPICDYRLGSAWTKRIVPISVIGFLNTLPTPSTSPSWV